MTAYISSSISEYFKENGYYLAQRVFSESCLQTLESDFDRIVEKLENSGENVNARWDSQATDELDGGESLIIHTHNVHRYSARWLQAFQQDEFLDTAEQIIGPDIILHHSKLFQKPAKAGAPFPMHQDWWYFPTKRDSMIAAVIFLGDTDDETGGFRVYPGSHKLGRKANTSGLHPSELLDKYPMTEATPISAHRGDVLFFSYFTLHGSMPNRSNRLRKTVLLQLYSGNDYLLDNEEVNHVNESLVLKGWNHHMTRDRAKL
jgi:phytanoyl-CoA hydroxylase